VDHVEIGERARPAGLHPTLQLPAGRIRCPLASDPERVPRSKAQPGRAGRPLGFWFLSMKSSPRARPYAEFLGGRGGVRAGKRGIDAGNVEALHPPAARGDQGRRRPASMQLIHHQVLASARADTTATYLRSPCSCVILECCARTIARAPHAGTAPSGQGGAPAY